MTESLKILVTELPINQVVCGDCKEVMKDFPSDSVDCVVTDPPYGIAFMGKKWDKALPPKEAFQQVYRVLKPGALAFVMSSPRQDVLWRMMAMLEECGFQLRQSFISWICKSGFPKAYDVSKGIDKKSGTFKKGKLTENARSGYGAEKGSFSHAKATYEDNPQSDLAKKWCGRKSITGLKPALECVLMVNKPLGEKTIVDNVLKHGTGAINVDACRIPFGDLVDKKKSEGNWKPNSSYPIDKTVYEYGSKILNTHQAEKGRFPANLLVSDKALDTGKITKSNGGVKATSQTIGGRGIYQGGDKRPYYNYGDVGGQSRYFDLDAWARHHGFLDVAKASKQERNSGLEGLPKRVKTAKRRVEDQGGLQDRIHGKVPKRNFHPTVKPIKLMAYLVELGCPKDGVVLDPFVGSGTTCLASHQLGRKWIGIEINEDYVNIARHRLTTLSQHLTKWTKND